MNSKDNIELIYKLAVDLWFEVADNNMLKRGHSGVMGNPSDEVFNEEYCVLMGAIQTLKDISHKIKPKKIQYKT